VASWLAVERRERVVLLIVAGPLALGFLGAEAIRGEQQLPDSGEKSP
jgi:hypothetical protein